jgi:hypothetical protein
MAPTFRSQFIGVFRKNVALKRGARKQLIFEMAYPVYVCLCAVEHSDARAGLRCSHPYLLPAVCIHPVHHRTAAANARRLSWQLHGQRILGHLPHQRHAGDV